MSRGIPSPDPDRFVVLARYRSGSNLLNESLNLVPGVRVLREIFNVANIVGDPRPYLDPDFVAKTFDGHRQEALRAIGFKLMYGQTSRQELAASSWGPNIPDSIRATLERINAWLARERLPASSFEHLLDQVRRDRGIKVVHLVRSNQLESYVSFQLALKEDNWMGTAYRTGPRGLVVHREDLEKYFTTGETQHAYYSELFKNHDMLNVTYDDLCNKYIESLTKVLSFIGITVGGYLAPPIRKQSTRKISDVVTNYEDLHRHFKDTRWGGYFREVPRSP